MIMITHSPKLSKTHFSFYELPKNLKSKIMKTIKTMALAIMTLTLISCGNETDTKQVQDAMKDGVETLQDLPEMKKEINKTQEAIENSTLNGKLSMILDDKGMILSTWDKRKSYLRFFDEKIVVRASRRKEQGQSIAIKINGSKLYEAQEKVYKTMNLGISEGSYAEFTFYDTNKGETDSPIIATDGEFVLSEIKDGYIQITFKGKGTQGKYEDKKEIDLSVDFQMDFSEELIKDNRSK